MERYVESRHGFSEISYRLGPNASAAFLSVAQRSGQLQEILDEDLSNLEKLADVVAQCGSGAKLLRSLHLQGHPQIQKTIHAKSGKLIPDIEDCFSGKQNWAVLNEVVYHIDPATVYNYTQSKKPRPKSRGRHPHAPDKQPGEFQSMVWSSLVCHFYKSASTSSFYEVTRFGTDSLSGMAGMNALLQTNTNIVLEQHLRGQNAADTRPIFQSAPPDLANIASDDDAEDTAAASQALIPFNGPAGDSALIQHVAAFGDSAEPHNRRRLGEDDLALLQVPASQRMVFRHVYFTK